jgi:hypothetical protein
MYLLNVNIDDMLIALQKVTDGELCKVISGKSFFFVEKQGF